MDYISFISNPGSLHHDFKEYMASPQDTCFPGILNFVDSSSLNAHPTLDSHSLATAGSYHHLCFYYLSYDRLHPSFSFHYFRYVAPYLYHVFGCRIPSPLFSHSHCFSLFPMNPRLRGESYQHCICNLLVLFVCLFSCLVCMNFGLSTIINSSHSLNQSIYLLLLGFSGEKSQSLQIGDSIHLFSSYSLDT